MTIEMANRHRKHCDVCGTNEHVIYVGDFFTVDSLWTIVYGCRQCAGVIFERWKPQRSAR
jgi:hypothetical protein